jgi:signal peptidase I
MTDPTSSLPQNDATDSSPSDQPEPAGFWLRVVAKLADICVLMVAAFVIMGVVALLHTVGAPGLWMFWLWLAGLLLVQIFYFAFFNSDGRQTFGYRLAGVQVRTMAQQPARLRQCTKRSLLSFMFNMANYLVIGYLDPLFVAFTKSKRALHDLWSGTQAVRIATPQSGKLLLAAIVLLPLGFVTFGLHPFLQAYFTPSGAMEDTLRVDDRLLANTLCYRLRAPRFQEIVIFRAPPAAHQGVDTDFIKRCIGVPGDVVYMKGRKLYRNGQLVNEPYVKWSSSGPSMGLIDSYDMKIVDGKVYSRDYAEPNVPGQWMVSGEPVPAADQSRISKAPNGAVPPGQYLMLGDHRNNSNDSHAWGFVPRANVGARAMLIFWPLTRLQGL